MTLRTGSISKTFRMKLSTFGSVSSEMLIFIFNAFGLLEISQAFLLTENNVCISENDTLICKCTGRENVTLDENMKFGTKWIIVEGCGEVNVPLGAIPHFQLEEFTFTDIDCLNIRPFSLYRIKSLHTLKIENVRQFELNPHGFVGLVHVTNVIIKNVHSKYLLPDVFGGISDIKKFHIENSHFEEVYDSAFVLTNISSFSIVNCTIGSMGNSAFLIHFADEVIFKSCNIKEMRNVSICLSYVDSFSFVNSHIEILSSNSIYTKSLQTFNFEGCVVSELETNAFALVDASEKITFINNVIKFADVYSLFISNENSTSQNVDIYSCCNKLTCDCNIYWIWELSEEPFYDDLLKDSSCIGKEAKLSSMIPMLDSHKNCKTLEMRTETPVPKQKPESRKKFQEGNTSCQAKLFETQFIRLIVFLGCILCMFM